MLRKEIIDTRRDGRIHNVRRVAGVWLSLRKRLRYIRTAENGKVNFTKKKTMTISPWGQGLIIRTSHLADKPGLASAINLL